MGTLTLLVLFLLPHIFILIALIFHQRKDFKKSAIMFLIGSVAFAAIFPDLGFGRFFPAVLFLVYAARVWKSMKTTPLFSIQLMGGTFSFVMPDYPQQEFSDFVQQASLLKAKKIADIKWISFNGTGEQTGIFVNQGYTPASSYQVSNGKEKNSGRTILIVVVLLVVVILGAAAIQAITHAANTCKARDCEDSVYMDGYCRYHYNTHRIDDGIKDVYDGLFGD